MEHCYITLSLVKRSQQASKEKSVFTEFANNPNARLPSYEILFLVERAEQINYENFFQFSNTSHNKDSSFRVEVRGRAGIGKTTFSKKIAYDFIHHELWQPQFKWLIWLPLRELKNFPKRIDNNPITLGDIFFHKYFNQVVDGEQEAKRLWQIILNEPKSVVFLLDGADEIVNEFENEHVKDVLKNLFTQSYVIVTARPHVDFDFQAHIVTETMGFTEEKMYQYMCHVLSSNSDTFKELSQFLKANPVVRGLANIPLHLDMLCSNWDLVKKRLLPQQSITLTQLYQSMVYSMWWHYLKERTLERLSKHEKIALENLKNQFQHMPNSVSEQEVNLLVNREQDCLEKLAFKAQLAHLIQFEPTWLQSAVQLDIEGPSLVQFNQAVAISNALKQTNFLTVMNESDDNRQAEYYFIHLTFQEYFTALYLMHWLKQEYTVEHKEIQPQLNSQQSTGITYKDAASFISAHRGDLRYHLSLSFMAGLLRHNSMQLKSLFDCLLRPYPVPSSSPSASWLTAEQLIYNYQHEKLMLVLIRCLEESHLAAGTSIFKELLPILCGYLVRVLFCIVPTTSQVKNMLQERIQLTIDYLKLSPTVRKEVDFEALVDAILNEPLISETDIERREKVKQNYGKYYTQLMQQKAMIRSQAWMLKLQLSEKSQNLLPMLIREMKTVLWEIKTDSKYKDNQIDFLIVALDFVAYWHQWHDDLPNLLSEIHNINFVPLTVCVNETILRLINEHNGHSLLPIIFNELESKHEKIIHTLTSQLQKFKHELNKNPASILSTSIDEYVKEKVSIFVHKIQTVQGDELLNTIDYLYRFSTLINDNLLLQEILNTLISQLFHQDPVVRNLILDVLTILSQGKPFQISNLCWINFDILYKTRCVAKPNVLIIAQLNKGFVSSLFMYLQDKHDKDDEKALKAAQALFWIFTNTSHKNFAEFKASFENSEQNISQEYYSDKFIIDNLIRLLDINFNLFFSKIILDEKNFIDEQIQLKIKLFLQDNYSVNLWQKGFKYDHYFNAAKRLLMVIKNIGGVNDKLVTSILESNFRKFFILLEDIISIKEPFNKALNISILEKLKLNELRIYFNQAFIINLIEFCIDRIISNKNKKNISFIQFKIIDSIIEKYTLKNDINIFNIFYNKISTYDQEMIVNAIKFSKKHSFSIKSNEFNLQKFVLAIQLLKRYIIINDGRVFNAFLKNLDTFNTQELIVVIQLLEKYERANNEKVFDTLLKNLNTFNSQELIVVIQLLEEYERANNEKVFDTLLKNLNTFNSQELIVVIQLLEKYERANDEKVFDTLLKNLNTFNLQELIVVIQLLEKYERANDDKVFDTLLKNLNTFNLQEPIVVIQLLKKYKRANNDRLFDILLKNLNTLNVQTFLYAAEFLEKHKMTNKETFFKTLLEKQNIFSSQNFIEFVEILEKYGWSNHKHVCNFLLEKLTVFNPEVLLKAIKFLEKNGVLNDRRIYKTLLAKMNQFNITQLTEAIDLLQKYQLLDKKYTVNTLINILLSINKPSNMSYFLSTELKTIEDIFKLLLQKARFFSENFFKKILKNIFKYRNIVFIKAIELLEKYEGNYDKISINSLLENLYLCDQYTIFKVIEFLERNGVSNDERISETLLEKLAKFYPTEFFKAVEFLERNGVSNDERIFKSLLAKMYRFNITQLTEAIDLLQKYQLLDNKYTVNTLIKLLQIIDYKYPKYHEYYTELDQERVIEILIQKAQLFGAKSFYKFLKNIDKFNLKISLNIIKFLGKYEGNNDEVFICKLIKKLKNLNSETFLMAVKLLEKYGRVNDKRVFSIILEKLSTISFWLLMEVIEFLEKYGYSNDERVFDALLEKLDARNSTTFIKTVEFLEKHGRADDERVFKALLKEIASYNLEMLMKAVEFLEKYNWANNTHIFDALLNNVNIFSLKMFMKFSELLEKCQPQNDKHIMDILIKQLYKTNSAEHFQKLLMLIEKRSLIQVQDIMNVIIKHIINDDIHFSFDKMNFILEQYKKFQSYKSKLNIQINYNDSLSFLIRSLSDIQGGQNILTNAMQILVYLTLEHIKKQVRFELKQPTLYSILKQARTLSQLRTLEENLKYMGESKIINQLLKYSDEGTLLDDKQRQKVVNYAVDRKTLFQSKQQFFSQVGLKILALDVSKSTDIQDRKFMSKLDLVPSLGERQTEIALHIEEYAKTEEKLKGKYEKYSHTDFLTERESKPAKTSEKESIHINKQLSADQVDSYKKPSTPLVKAILQWEQHTLHKPIKNSLSNAQTDEEKHRNYENIADSYGFNLVDVPGDGKCFFHAVLHQLIKQHDERYLYLTIETMIEKVVAHLLNHMDSYKKFIIHEDLNSLIEGLLDGTKWADDICVFALSRELKINLVILQSDESQPIIIKRPEANLPIVYLFYEIEYHYQSLVKVNTKNASKNIQFLFDQAKIDLFNDTHSELNEREYSITRVNSADNTNFSIDEKQLQQAVQESIVDEEQRSIKEFYKMKEKQAKDKAEKNIQNLNEKEFFNLDSSSDSLESEEDRTKSLKKIN